MEPHFTKPLQSYFPPLNSLDSSETLPSSPPDNTANLSQNLSAWRDSTVPDSELSDDDGLLDETEVDDIYIAEKGMSILSPIRSKSNHWSQSWSNIHDHKPTELPLRFAEENKASLSDRTLCSDSNARPSFMALLTGFKPPIVGAGLANLRNTCFLNAVMQCFTHTVPLLMRLVSCRHRFPCHVHRFEGFCVLCALLEHLNLSLKFMGKVVAPWTLVNNLSYFSSSFWKYQQEDAHEFLQCFLDKLETGWNDAILMDASSESNNIVRQVFGGRLVSRLRCCNCDYCSYTYEPSIDLSLEIDDADSLYGALDSFTKVEKIEDSEMKFTCENCKKEQVFVEKQLILDQTPCVAAFHLKRFKNDGCFVEKIDKHVAFPLELNLRSYTVGYENAELMYDLYAVVVHIGFSSNSGHYYCFIRSAPRMWYKFDDDQVTWVDEKLVLSQEAYILFYAKQGTPCFASFFETQNNNYIYIPVVNTSPKSAFDNMDASTSSSSLPSECQNDGHEEINDAADEVSTLTVEKPGLRIDERGNDENRMPNYEEIHDAAVEASTLTVEKPGFRIDERENDENRMPDLTPLVVSNSSMAASPCIAEENDFNDLSRLKHLVKDAKESDSNDFPPQLRILANDTPTRLRLPNPEKCLEDPHEKIFIRPGGRTGSADEGEDNSEKMQAFDFVDNSMSETRGLKYLAVMGGSLSEGSCVNKKRGRGMHSVHYRSLRQKGGIKRANLASFR